MAKILIIGGGVSGLSAGIYAQLNGHQAVVCEKHFIPGGNLTGWQRGEYHIDNCIHWLTGTNPASRFYSMWNDLGTLGRLAQNAGYDVEFASVVKGGAPHNSHNEGGRWVRICLGSLHSKLRFV